MTDYLSPEDQRWCDVLAGRLPHRLPAHINQPGRAGVPGQGQPCRDVDDELRMAGLLREALADPDGPPPPPLDDATLDRMMRGLEARGSFDLQPQRQPAAAGQPARAATAAPTHAQVPPAWHPGQGAAGAAIGAGAGAGAGRPPAWQQWAVPATALVAMLAMLWLLNQGQGPQPGHGAGAGNGSGSGGGGGSGAGNGFAKSAMPGPAMQAVQAADPDAAAVRLVAALTVLGVQSTVQSDGDDRIVQAWLPPPALAQADAALQVLSLAAPGDGRLSVRFTQANR